MTKMKKVANQRRVMKTSKPLIHSQYAMARMVLLELIAESQAKSFQYAQVINYQLRTPKELADFFQNAMVIMVLQVKTASLRLRL
jgi:hypothetical protein